MVAGIGDAGCSFHGKSNVKELGILQKRRKYISGYAPRAAKLRLETESGNSRAEVPNFSSAALAFGCVRKNRTLRVATF